MMMITVMMIIIYNIDDDNVNGKLEMTMITTTMVMDVDV